VRVDLTDYGQVADVLGGAQGELAPVEAVVHLAAIPAPGLAPDAVTFANNVVAGFNVLHAAVRQGIRRVVTASSETVLGLPFDTPPPYVPVDEDYPARPESVYSLGKHLEETMAVELCRWHPDLTVSALRFSNVMDVEDYAEFPSFDADPRLRRWNLWGYIDGRDGAQAVERALERTGPGFDRFVIASPDTVMSRASADLVAEVFPGVEVRKELGEHETLLSIDRARRVLGYAPEHSWRDEVRSTP
jgi:UDP-glucose 4-epimerase